MKQRWWRLRLAGYNIRKLNQAYFAFRGTYASNPASVSPINEQMQEMRRLSPSLRAFITTISGVSSYSRFLEVLEELRAGAPAQDGRDGETTTSTAQLGSGGGRLD